MRASIDSDFGNIVIGIITVNKKVQKSRENKKKEIQDIFHINQANFEQIQKNGDIRPIQVNQIPKESPEQKAIVILNKTDPTKESVIKDVVLNGLSLNQNKDVLVFVDEAFHEEIEAEPKGLPHIPAPIVPAIDPEKERVLKNLEVNGLALQYVNDKFKGDKDVVKKAVAACGYALEYASKRLQNDKELVLLAVARDGGALQQLKKEEKFILEAAKINSHIFLWVNESLMNKKDFVLQMVKINGEMIELAHPDLKKDMAVATAAAVQNIKALQFVDPMIRNIVEKAVLEQEAILE